MSLYIKSIQPASNDEWDDIWINCSTATYFHSREWAEIWKNYSRNRMDPAPLMIEFSDRKSALLPLSRRKLAGGLLQSYHSSAAGTFGGWISHDRLDRTHVELLLNLINSRFPWIAWRVNPYDTTVSDMGRAGSTYDETHALNLTAGFDHVFKSWNSSHQRAARKALREGVTVEVASSKADWLDYYGVYLETLERWGSRATQRYEWRLFEDFHRLDSPFVKLWLAVQGGKAIAGALCFYAQKHSVYWHGAASGAHLNVRPVNLLMYEIIREACEAGYTWFDFNPSGDLEGVKAFKRGFGARALPCPVICREPRLLKKLNESIGQVRRLLDR